MVSLSGTPKSRLPPMPSAAAGLLPTLPLGFSLGPFRPRLPPCSCFLAIGGLLSINSKLTLCPGIHSAHFRRWQKVKQPPQCLGRLLILQLRLSTAPIRARPVSTREFVRRR